MNEIEYLTRKGEIALLKIKDTQIRKSIIEQAVTAVDKGVHIGGAFSVTPMLVCLYYGGFIRNDIGQPAAPGQDIFILSKGHAVAALASVYADLGYFSREILVNSRSRASILNGHPGPLLPGVHISTGPLGQGVCAAAGFAVEGSGDPEFDVYAVTGDGELQEGSVWEAVMFAGSRGLENLCLIVDRNGGQLDTVDRLVIPPPDYRAVFESFGWRVLEARGEQYGSLMEAFSEFKFGHRGGKPTVILVTTTKGAGGKGLETNKHKAVYTKESAAQETEQQDIVLRGRIGALERWLDCLSTVPEDTVKKVMERISTCADRCAISVSRRASEPAVSFTPPAAVRTDTAAVRDKKIRFDETALPRYEQGKEYEASKVITECMRVFAMDPRVVSLDSDLSSTSGLLAGVGFVSKDRALNVGIAESNMMCMGEAFAVTGKNVWVSTFCPFFDWRVMRRIAIGWQERQEVIDSGTGWLSEGHNLDLTFLATAPNFETKTNGATHMGNDDSLVFGEIAHLKIIDVSCPNQLKGVMKWIMEGNKGLCYVRIMRSPSGVIYGDAYDFTYGKGHVLRAPRDSRIVIISSGREVHEALQAVDAAGSSAGSDTFSPAAGAGVVDMPSFDPLLSRELHDAGMTLIVAEQNNGFLYRNIIAHLGRSGGSLDPSRIIPVNTSTPEGKPQFIHSATYSELTDAYGLSAARLADRIGGMRRQG